MQNKFEIIDPTLFVIEALVSKELYRLGYDVKKTEDGKVTFDGDFDAVCRANMWLRCGERVLIKIGEFKAETADELYDNVYNLPWESFIRKDDAFPVKGRTIRSVLNSDRNSQIMIKKAIADRLGHKYHIARLPETGIAYQVQFTIVNNIVTLMIDTTGVALHKRGYRTQANLAPLRETIAASMVMISYWKFEEPLLDPFCGSGTIPIESAMFKRNIAPGLTRHFAFESFYQVDKSLIEDVIAEAKDSIHRDVTLDITASDIDPYALEITEHNAKRAGVAEFIDIRKGDARKIITDKECGSIITNPPYGERLSDLEESKALYRDIYKSFSRLPKWSYYILTSHEEFEREFGRKADRRRKIYNGMLRCWLYQYYGNKPNKKNNKKPL